MNSEDFVVPNYQETSDSYPFLDMWDGWSMNSQKSAEKCFDFDVLNNGFTGGLYSRAADDCFYRPSNLLDFNGIQQMDDIFLSSILEDVPGNKNLYSYKDSDDNSPGSSSTREVPMFSYNWETCYDKREETPLQISDLCQENMMQPSTEEVVLQNLQRATEELTYDTRKCFRDTFYRLAKNSQQVSESGNSNSDMFLADRSGKTELETNSIDRAVANLTFNKMESNMRNLPLPT